MDDNMINDLRNRIEYLNKVVTIQGAVLLILAVTVAIHAVEIFLLS